MEQADIETADGVARTQAATETPATVGRYTLLRRLGQGGMGVVHEAYDPELDRRVAVKLLRPRRGGTTAHIRLLREAQALARLSHPNVVAVHDVGEDDGRVFVAMELVDGPTLKAWSEAEDRDWREIVETFVAAGRGLEAAHATGMVHRDFKPSNVLVPTDGPVRVVDFGLANFFVGEPDLDEGAGEARIPSRFDGLLTGTGVALGTPVFMAPEQHAGLRVGPAADQFAFCVSLYEALYDERPFAAENSFALATAVLEQRPRRPASVSGPGRLLEIVLKGLEREPDDRFDSMSTLLEALRRVLGRRAAVRRWALGLGVIGLLAVSPVVSFATSRACESGSEEIRSIWSDSQRDDIARSHEKVASLGGDGAPVLDRLDDFAGLWVATRVELCSVHRQGELSDPLFDEGMACLDVRLAGFAEAVHQIETRSADELERAGVAVGKLASPDLCRTRAALLASGSGAGLDDRREVRRSIAQAEVEHRFGAAEEALASLDSLLKTSATEDGLAAEVLLAKGQLQIEAGDFDDAAGTVDGALASATRARAEVIEAEAWTRRVYLDELNGTPALRTLSIARASVDRLDPAIAPRALLLNNEGVALAMHGNRLAAMAKFSAALETGVGTRALDPVERAGALVNLALVTQEPRRRDQRFAEAQALERRLVGRHQLSAETAVSRGRSLFDSPAGRESLEDGCDMLAEVAPESLLARSQCELDLFDADPRFRENPDRLRRFLRIAVPPLADMSPGNQLEPLVRRLEARVALASDAPQDALTLSAQARALLLPHAELPWVRVDLADVALLEAQALDALGRLPEAREHLLAARDAYAEKQETSYARAWVVRAERVESWLSKIDGAEQSP